MVTRSTSVHLYRCILSVELPHPHRIKQIGLVGWLVGWFGQSIDQTPQVPRCHYFCARYTTTTNMVKVFFVICTCLTVFMTLSHAKALLSKSDREASSSMSGQVGVLVFGDSQGDTGPTYQVVQDQLQDHNVSHKVISVAVGGTLSCGWAQDPKALAKAAQNQFGSNG